MPRSDDQASPKGATVNKEFVSYVKHHPLRFGVGMAINLGGLFGLLAML